MTTSIVVLSILLIATIYYRIEMARKSQILFQLEPSNQCSLHKGACDVSTPAGGKITLSITPRPIPLVKEIQINVTTQSIDTQSVKVDFKGTTIKMTPNLVTLVQQSKSTYTGQGLLPICIRNSMEWQATVIIQTDEGIIKAPFLFTTFKNRPQS